MRLTRFDIVSLSLSAVLALLIAITVILGSPPDSGGLRVAYLYPADKGPFNIWIADPSIPNSARQVTNSQEGIYDYDTAPNGRYIAYAEQNFETSTSELMLLDLNTNNVAQLTNCRNEDADCVTPVWRSDSKTIAYQRRQFNTALGLGISPSRIWILELEPQPRTYALFEDSQILGADQSWSADGSALAFFEAFGRNIMVYDFNAPTENERIKVIPSDSGITGRLSPNGDQIVFPLMVSPGDSGTWTTLLNVADLSTGVFRPLTPDETLLNDSGAAWHPDGKRVAITRRYYDERATRGEQIYLVDLATNGITQLVNDPNYSHGAITWSPDGTQLLMQRFNHTTSLPEIWTYDMTSGRLTKVAEKAFFGRWVPPRAD